MRTFSFYIHDARYSVPTLQLADALDELAAKALAERYLGDSAEHHVVEVMEDEALLFRVGREAQTAGA